MLTAYALLKVIKNFMYIFSQRHFHERDAASGGDRDRINWDVLCIYKVTNNKQ